MNTYERDIIRHVSRRDYSPVKLSAIAKSLGVSDEDYPEFKAAFQDLRRQGRVVIGPKNLITLPEMSGRVIGTFRANPKGFGFVVPLEPNSHGDLFIGPRDTNGAMTGDTVSARVVKKGRRAGEMRYNGIIEEILERGRNRLVGILQRLDGQWIVKPDGKEFFEPIVVDDVGAKNAKVNDKVIVEILTFATERCFARGVIVDVLGKAGLYDSETRSIIAQYKLPEAFPEETLAQAHLAAASFNADAAEGRDDITNETIITIDPPDARDFDDAISLKRNKDGNWVLGVHIADVAAFVTMNSPLDAEARLRGNSTYLPRKVIPMLPETLSNGVCSLQPNQKRFAKSVYITYDRDGNVLGREFANSIICSTARLTYLEADAIIRGDAKGWPGEVVALLKDMETLARAIEKRRDRHGMLHLDLPETELIFDDEGRVVDAQPADTCYPHTIIEMFMVEANEAVASLLDRFNIPFMRRIHPDPDPASTKNLARVVKLCGLKVPRTLDRAAIQDLLAAVKGKPASYAVNMYILRSLQKAEYAPSHIGHFALASKNYCHFTSPIRRYADLLVHRLLQCYLDHHLNLIGLEEVLPESELAEIGRHISFTEQRSADAERELKTVLILQMLSTRIGCELNCVVSGLTNFGIFAQCTKYGIEGLIEFGDLGLDEWRFDERAQAVVGLHSQKSVHLGQDMKVRVVEVNIPARQLTLAPVEPLVSSRQRFNTPQNRRKARKTRKERQARRR
ncbi:MAG TPA: ribonuclease R [Anaerohalosphaeraceae bacterium]|jgi:ribonuclease R|nr:ribonuclease R [Anaerohalosphaeraceae bacterium]HRT50660.1 ribonuclease R [Anaerohalosphaeraceae bacterium]HRT86642.1 ribonuclease R [Anaerohalosphaeraceae bacterium]